MARMLCLSIKHSPRPRVAGKLAAGPSSRRKSRTALTITCYRAPPTSFLNSPSSKSAILALQALNCASMSMTGRRATSPQAAICLGLPFLGPYPPVEPASGAQRNATAQLTLVSDSRAPKPAKRYRKARTGSLAEGQRATTRATRDSFATRTKSARPSVLSAPAALSPVTNANLGRVRTLCA